MAILKKYTCIFLLIVLVVSVITTAYIFVGEIDYVNGRIQFYNMEDYTLVEHPKEINGHSLVSVQPSNVYYDNTSGSLFDSFQNEKNKLLLEFAVWFLLNGISFVFLYYNKDRMKTIFFICVLCTLINCVVPFIIGIPIYH